MKNEIVSLNNELTIKNIEDMIYKIRGKYVILDSNVALLYNYETRNINKAVKRNIERFPEDFYFQLSKEEYNDLMFQFGTSRLKLTHGGTRKMPYVFTEYGIIALAGILRNDIATEISIKITRVFISMKKYISNNLLQQQYINDMVIEDHNKIILLEKTFNKLQEKQLTNEIYFKGQIFDAYSKIKEIFNKAKYELVIIDAYADITLLDIIKDIKVKVILITKEKSLLRKLDIEKYNSQYNNLEIIYNNEFHDRFFIIDNKEFYHCGTSVNYAGNKTFAINILTEETMIKPLKHHIKELINNNNDNIG